MAKKSFWQGLKDYFKDEGPHLITDEEWEAMQAQQRQAEEAADAPDDAVDEMGDAAADGTLGVSPGEAPDAWPQMTYWRCPECHTANPEPLLFCARCGYHPGSFRDVLSRMTTEQIELVLGGSCRYPAAELRLLEGELARRRAPATPAASPAPEGEIDPAELARLAQRYQDSPDAALYEVLADPDYTPTARHAARAELARRGLPADPAAADPALAPAVSGWKCTRCGKQNAEEAYFCTACGEYRY